MYITTSTWSENKGNKQNRKQTTLHNQANTRKEGTTTPSRTIYSHRLCTERVKKEKRKHEARKGRYYTSSDLTNKGDENVRLSMQDYTDNLDI